MGRLGFTEYFHLLLTGDEPTEDQRYFLDLLLVAIAEHGMMPTNVAARMTLAADPRSLQGAVAAGILRCGPGPLGTAGEGARLPAAARGPGAGGAAPPPAAGAAPRGGRLAAARARVGGGAPPAQAAGDAARAVRESGGRLPGFGHPVHKPLDPRAERILTLADEREASGPHVALARCFCDAAAEAWGR